MNNNLDINWEENFEVLELNIQGNFIKGRIKNKKEFYRYVRLTFNIYDSEKCLIKNENAFISFLDKNEIWKFNILCSEDFRSCKIVNIEGVK